MKKLSFDYDETLDNEIVQKYVKFLIEKEYDIHIVTSRPINWQWDNSDVYETAEKLNIKRENIHFTNFVPKYKFFENEDFLFHLDNDNIEILEINNFTKTKGILYEQDWLESCNELIKEE